MLTGSDNPVLDRHAISRGVRFQYDRALEGDGLMPLLGTPEVIADDRAIVPSIEDLRVEGAFTSAPQVAVPIQREQSGAQVEFALFQQYTDYLDTRLASAMADLQLNPGGAMRTGFTSAMANQQINAWVAKHQESLARVYMRHLKRYLCTMMTSTGAFNVTVDGVTVSHNYSPNVVTSTAAWNVAGTNIARELERAIQNHEDTFGVEATHLVWNPALRTTLMANTQYQTFAQGAGSQLQDDLARNWPLSARDLQTVSVRERSRANAAAAMSDMWDSTMIGILTIGSAEASPFTHFTTASKDNDFAGGVGARLWEPEDPPRWQLRVAGGHGIGLTGWGFTLFDLGF